MEEFVVVEVWAEQLGVRRVLECSWAEYVDSIHQLMVREAAYDV